MPRNSNAANIRGATYDSNHSEVGGQGVPRNQTTLPQMLAKANYWGAFAGKWDVGFATQGHIPAGRGYASSLAYFFQINDYMTQGMVGSEGNQCPDGKVDLWEDFAPAHHLNSTAYEEVLFENHLHAALETFAAPSGPASQGKSLFLHYAPHLVHDPYTVRRLPPPPPPLSVCLSARPPAAGAWLSYLVRTATCRLRVLPEKKQSHGEAARVLPHPTYLTSPHLTSPAPNARARTCVCPHAPTRPCTPLRCPPSGSLSSTSSRPRATTSKGCGRSTRR